MARVGITAKSRKWKKNKKNGNRNGKPPQAGQGQKWPKNGFLREFSIISFLGHFFAIFAPVQLGAVFHFDFHFMFFFPFPAVGRFPCHASPAGSQGKSRKTNQGEQEAKPSKKVRKRVRIF